MSKVFGKRLREIRKKEGLYLKDVAQETGVVLATVSSWERGKSEPTLDQINAIADLFNVSTDYLLGRIDFIQQQYLNKLLNLSKK